MKLRFLCVVVLCLAITGFVQAKKKTKKKNKSDLVLVEAFTQRILPGMRRSTPPPVTTHFIVVWEGVGHPDAFLWRADTSLQTCNVTKAHKITVKSFNNPPGKEYNNEKIDPKGISKGDTLDIVPLSGISPTPRHLHIEANAGNTLYYSTPTPTIYGEEWFSLYIDTIAKKRDIAMP